jgi:hypothetical protein
MIKFHVIRPFKVGDIVRVCASPRGMHGVVQNVWNGSVRQRVRVEWSNGSTGFASNPAINASNQLCLVD